MLSSPQMQHFIITPFYVRRDLRGKRDTQLPSEAWLEHRLRLFEQYCLPSVAAQTNRNFDWFIYFDSSTPERYLERLRALTAGCQNAAIKLCSFWDSPTIISHVVAALAPRTRWIITSRLDNDDGLRADFVSRLQTGAAERREILNFPQGIILYSGRCYLYRHLSNAFLSLVEPADNPRTAFSLAHEEADQVAPIRQLDEAPAFLQVVHERNYSNKPRGTRVARQTALAGFDGVAAARGAGGDDSALQVVADNLTRGMMWKARDLLIMAAKALRRHTLS